MKRATVTEAKNRLSALLAEVKGGETILIVERGIPIARIEPVPSAWSDDGRVERLVRMGVLRPGRGGVPDEILTTSPPRLKDGVSIVDIILEERREGR